MRVLAGQVLLRLPALGQAGWKQIMMELGAQQWPDASEETLVLVLLKEGTL